MSLKSEEKEKIINALNSRAGAFSCPICKNKKFILIDGYFNNFLQDDLYKTSIGRKGIPSVVSVCGNCGFIAQFSAGVLGLLKEEKEE